MGTPGGHLSPTTLIVHSEATKGRALPGPNGLEWHFFILYDGSTDQHVDTSRQAQANNKANRYAVSAETEDAGFPDSEPWTIAQVDTIVELALWLRAEHGIALRETPCPTCGGVGYHTLHGAPSDWTPVVKTCPGRARILQWRLEVLPRIIARNVPQPEEHPFMAGSVVVTIDPVSFVEGLYRVLGPAIDQPEPDPAGAHYWLRLLLAGTSPAEVEESFAAAVFAAAAEKTK